MERRRERSSSEDWQVALEPASELSTGFCDECGKHVRGCNLVRHLIEHVFGVQNREALTSYVDTEENWNLQIKMVKNALEKQKYMAWKIPVGIARNSGMEVQRQRVESIRREKIAHVGGERMT